MAGGSSGRHGCQGSSGIGCVCGLSGREDGTRRGQTSVVSQNFDHHRNARIRACFENCETEFRCSRCNRLGRVEAKYHYDQKCYSQQKKGIICCNRHTASTSGGIFFAIGAAAFLVHRIILNYSSSRLCMCA